MSEKVGKTGNGAADNGNKGKAQNIFAEILDWVSCVFSAVICFIIVFTLFARIMNVDGPSMNNTLIDKDRLIVSDFAYTPQYGDIVVVYADKLANDSGSFGKPIIKRIIGLPGDRIRINFEEGVVYRNGEALYEPYTATPTNQRENFPNHEIVVEEGKVFVMGDNRNISKDSRSNDIGQVDMRYIIGKAYLRIWPFSSFGEIYK